MRYHIVDMDDTLCRTTLDLGGDRAQLGRLKLYDDVPEYLECSNAYKVLVTAGEEAYQRSKIEHLRLAPYFDEIRICPSPEDKKGVFASIVEYLGVAADDVMIIGDRLEADIRFGNELGVVTVRMRRDDGKYSKHEPSGLSEIPSYEVSSFIEVIEKLCL